MFKTKNVMLAVAVSMLLAACGGGSDSPSSSVGTGTGTGTGTGSGNTAAAADALRGSLVNVGNEIEFSDVGITTTQFSTLAGGVGPFARGTNAPLTNFGFRIAPQNMDGAAAQSKTASVSFDLSEQASSVGAGETAEALQILIDKVTVNAAADGTFSIADTAGSKVYVYYKPATGTAAVTSAAANGLVTIKPVAGDTTSNILSVDLETAVTRAIAASTGATATTMNQIKNSAGLFNMKAVLSNVHMFKADGTTTMDSTGVTMTQGGQISAAGGSASGVIQLQ